MNIKKADILQPTSKFLIFTRSYLCWISQIINTKYNLSEIAEQKTEYNCNQDASQFCFSFLWAWDRLKNLNVHLFVGKKYDVSILFYKVNVGWKYLRAITLVDVFFLYSVILKIILPFKNDINKNGAKAWLIPRNNSL